MIETAEQRQPREVRVSEAVALAAASPRTVGDLTGLDVGEALVVCLERTGEGASKSRMWLLECSACGRRFERSTGALMMRVRDRKSNACVECNREVELSKRTARSNWRLREQWDMTGSLYAHSPEELVDRCPPSVRVSTSMNPEEPDATPSRERASREVLMLWQLYPIRSDGGWLCVTCGSLFTAGLACVECIEPVCRACVAARNHLHNVTDEYTLDELGKVFGVGRERIRQIEAKALRKLRHPSCAKMLREFVDQP